jgi:hypothetical protein
VHGEDKRGRPLIMVRASRHSNTKDRTLVQRQIVFIIDEALARVDRGGREESFCGIIDLTDFGRANLDVEAAQMIVKMLGVNFPERLGAIYIAHSGRLFWGLWKIIEPFIDQRTRKKIVFLPSDFAATLLEEFEPDQLPPSLGGTSSFEYSIEHVTKVRQLG